MRIWMYTVLALVAFAANSVLCRLALANSDIDAITFSTLRLCAGALMLVMIRMLHHRQYSLVWMHGLASHGNWRSTFVLFSYVVCFSFSYIHLNTGTGALILFGFVQITMICFALISGERPAWYSWCGYALALMGVAYLLYPGVSAPPLLDAMLMAVAGISWGIYSILGRQSHAPLADTTSHFLRTVPVVLVMSVCLYPLMHGTANGIMLAILSGALASGVGYAIWYAALAGLTTTQAASVQLIVPVLAAVGGVLFVSESVSLHLLFSAVLILGGIAMVLFTHRIQAGILDSDV